MYVGTYTRKDSKGIYAFRFDSATGKLKPLGLAAETPNPSFLAIHPNGKYLYSVSEQGAAGGGAVSSFQIDHASGKLTALNTQSTKGSGPCHLVVDKTGRSLVVVNYGSGSTTVLPVGADGKLGEASGHIQHSGSSVNRQRQQGPHAHSVNLSPDNRFAIVADLGLDKVLVYKFDAAKGTIAPHTPPAADVKPGSGPRHFSFHPSGKYGYVINEMLMTVTAFRYDPKKGTLTEIQTIPTVAEGPQPGYSTAEVLVHPSGKFLYGSNRGHNSIAMFTIDPSNGKLTHIGNEPTQGRTPRNFRIDPTGSYLLAENQDTDSIVVFSIDKTTGKLTPTGEKVSQPAPVCIRFVETK